jgi:hypothetical protein
MWTGKRKCRQETKFGQTMLKKGKSGYLHLSFCPLAVFPQSTGFFPLCFTFRFLSSQRKNKNKLSSAERTATERFSVASCKPCTDDLAFFVDFVLHKTEGSEISIKTRKDNVAIWSEIYKFFVWMCMPRALGVQIIPTFHMPGYK